MIQKANTYRRSATGRRKIEEEVYTTEDLFKIRDNLEKKAKVQSQKYCTRLRKRKPEFSSYSKSRKTSIDSFLDEDEHLQKSSNKPLTTEARASKQNPKLKEKLDRFLRGLESHSNQDIDSNSQVLADIIDNFANSYGIKPHTIASMISEGEDLNIESLRRKILQLSKRE